MLVATQPVIRVHRQKIGIDIGRTIVDTDNPDKPPFPEAIRVIRRLVDFYGDKNVFIVSKVTDAQKLRALRWIRRTRFHEETDMREENVEFCLERHEKAPICQRLGVTAFIDDRVDVLSHMRGIVSHRILFRANHASPKDGQMGSGGVIRASSWKQIEEIFLPTWRRLR